MPFRFTSLEIDGLVLVEPEVFTDTRGSFMETYRYSVFAAFGIKERFLQDGHSRSTKDVLRGLHYQRHPKAQGMLVRAVVGEIFDVAVDIRVGSSTYGRWVSQRLSAANRRMLYVPPWCAHGYCVTSDEAEILYKMTSEYSPELEGGVVWNDPQVAIRWPTDKPHLSTKDSLLPPLRDAGNDSIYEATTI